MKKQFRLYDIYRTLVTDYKSTIKGIVTYSVEQHPSDIHIQIKFEDKLALFDTYCRDEKELKLLVREVNKNLGNCRKPGKKKGQKIVMTSSYCPNITR